MDRYTHTLRGAEAAALATLPNYSTQAAGEAQRTGTDDTMPFGGNMLPQSGGKSGELQGGKSWPK